MSHQTKNLTKNFLLKKQLNKILEHAIKSHLVVPALFATCSICNRPTQQRISLDEKDDLLRIDYPCIFKDCKEVKEETHQDWKNHYYQVPPKPIYIGEFVGYKNELAKISEIDNRGKAQIIFQKDKSSRWVHIKDLILEEVSNE